MIRAFILLAVLDWNTLGGLGWNTLEAAPVVRSHQSSYAAAYAEHKATGRPLVVLFGAAWCGPCKVVQAQHGDALARMGCFAHIDIDSERAMARRLCPSLFASGGRIPRLVIYRRKPDGSYTRREYGPAEIAGVVGAP